MVVIPVSDSVFADRLYITAIDYSHKRAILFMVLLTIRNPSFVEITCTGRKLPLVTFFSCGKKILSSPVHFFL